MKQALDAFWPWLSRKELAGVQRAFAAWITRVAVPSRGRKAVLSRTPSLLEVRSMLAERAKKWLEDAEARGEAKGIRKGIQKGRQEGIQEAKVGTLRTNIIAVLEARFQIVGPSIRRALSRIEDEVVLKSLHRQAVVVENMREFRDLLK